MEINSSLIKRFLKKGNEIDICPKYINLIHIDKLIEEEGTLNMLKGCYFESRTLGKGAKGNIVTDLPRKAKGVKTTDHERIDNQVLVFKQVCAKYQININEYNTQVLIKKRWEKNPDIMLHGELDIFPTAVLSKEGLKLATIDLKLTSNIDNTFGDFCWGSPSYLDHIQADMYNYLVRDIDFELNPHLKDIIPESVLDIINNNWFSFYYLVFDYKKDSKWKPIERKWDNTIKSELFESIRKTERLINKYDLEGWNENPSYEKCKNCPISDCKSKCFSEKT
jgi:hypothetical protein